jgi:hypothetical protein
MAEVLPAQLQSEGQSYFPPSSLRRSPPSQTSLFIDSKSPFSTPPSRGPDQYAEDSDAYSNSPTSSSPESIHVGLAVGSSSSFSSNGTAATSVDMDSESDEDELSFPGYDRGFCSERQSEDDPPPSPRDMSHAANEATHSPTPDIIFLAEDDSAIKQEPSRHVDYLSHDWREEDIWSSWKHIVSKRKVYGERSRLENASWRTWAKQKYQLKTVPPDSLNW